MNLSSQLNIGNFLLIISNNCANHQSNTRHVEEKYHLYARTLRQAILLKYPMIRVCCKPITTNSEDFMRSIKVDKINEQKICIENFRPEMRLGAFEIQLCKKVKGEIIQELLHSKLQTRYWPNVNVILNRIGNIKIYPIGKHVPHTNINVKLYSTSSEEKMKNIKITLTANSEKLDEIAQTFNESLNSLDEKYQTTTYIKRIHNEKTEKSITLGPRARIMTSYNQRKNYVIRPTSAITNRSLNTFSGL